MAVVTKARLAELLEQGEIDTIAAFARGWPVRVVRFLTGRLYSADEAEKWNAVRALGAVCADRNVMPPAKLLDFMRRFFWALSDESGAVPFGVPEAVGEVLAQRPELHKRFLPVLCSMLAH